MIEFIDMDLGITIMATAVVILIFSVIVHEVMHGLVALKFGDKTAQMAGRLTLNPLPHIDPVGTILLPIMFFVLPLLTGFSSSFFIAWAKPVPVNPLNFTDIRKGELFVSLAGVLSNFGLALIGTLLYHLTSGQNILLSTTFQFLVGINLMLGIFNLLPIPPLDGSKVLMSRLPYNLAREYEKISQYGIFILLALLYFNVIGLILRTVLVPLYSILGVPPL